MSEKKNGLLNAGHMTFYARLRWGVPETQAKSAYTLKTGIPVEEGDRILKLLRRVSRPEIQISMDVNYMLSSMPFFWKFEYPCETKLPGSMGGHILNMDMFSLIFSDIFS